MYLKTEKKIAPNINDHGTECTIIPEGFHNTIPPYHFSKGHDWKWETVGRLAV